MTFVFIQSSYRLAIRTEGMIYDLVKNIKSENQELQMHCASAIFKVGCSSVGTFERKNNIASLCAWVFWYLCNLQYFAHKCIGN